MVIERLYNIHLLVMYKKECENNTSNVSSPESIESIHNVLKHSLFISNTLKCIQVHQILENNSCK